MATEKQVLRLKDGSFAVCEVDRARETTRLGQWRYSEIQRAWIRTLVVLKYRGTSLAEAEYEAFTLGALP